MAMASTSAPMAGDENTPPQTELQQPYQSPRRPQHKRARTGCERCRARRRKCDEGKPRCGRCIEANAECQYVAHIQFVVNNSLNVADKPVSLGEPSSLLQPGRDEPENAAQVLPEAEPPAVVADASVSAELGMVALDNNPAPDVLMSDMLQPMATALRWDEKWPIVGKSSLTGDEVELLRHYSRVVAPWLDVFDLSRTFGLLVPQLALASPCIMDGILQLSAASLGVENFQSTESREIGSLFLLAMTQLVGHESTALSALRIVTSVLLLKSRVFVTDGPDKWEPCIHGGGIPFGFDKYSFTDPVLRGVWHGCIALISRTEIAYCLINETAPAMDPSFLRSTLATLPPNTLLSGNAATNIVQTGLDSSTYCLAILTDVMIHVLPHSDRSDPALSRQGNLQTTSIRNEHWKALLEQLLGWYVGRPSELQTLVDTENKEAAFPIILFTSAMGIWTNTMYHTAMILLLNQRPRSISLVDFLKGTELDKGQISPMWHARRVCGIALNSDPEATRCWEPCMIAAFSVAARRMTHPTQQNALVTCLNRVKALGWRLDTLIQSLHEEWGTDEL